MPRSYFNPKLFQFCEELSRNNNRDWFQRNKLRYEHEVREPTLRFIADFAPRLRQISRYYVADPSPTGGSMMRIYRNLRFSRDKTPYKTNVAVAFGHRDASRFESPSFYFSLSHEEAFFGVGVWHPDPEAARKVRDAIAAHPSRWKSAINDRKFTARLTLIGDSLSRPPKGFDPAHPLIDDLKRKDFVAGTDFTRPEVCSPKFLDLFTGVCESAAPFMKFLTESLGFRW